MDIQRCRDLDLDNTLYKRWEELLNSLVHTANESDCCVDIIHKTIPD